MCSKAIIARKIPKFNSHSIIKTLLVMKITMVAIVAMVVQVHAAGYGQVVSLSQKNAKLLTTLKQIEKQTDYFFWYENELLRQSKPVNIQIANKPLKEALDDCFKDQSISYEIVDRTILLRPKPIPASPGQHTELSEADRNLRGTVKDAAGNPVPGATVLIKNTGKGVVTNANGEFSINASPGDVLIISSIGYQRRELTVGNNTEVSIQLKMEEGIIDAVVVTALGIKRNERSLTYNLQTIGGKEVNDVRNASFVNSLTGKVAGVTINSTPGIGGSTRVIMRGLKSISGNNGALYVVDGIPLQQLSSAGQAADNFGGTDYGDGISNLNPDDIESISVLSGASAAALYGGQAANGVVLINTKKGVEGKLRVNFSSGASIYNPLVKVEEQNKYGSTTSSTGNKSFESWGPALSTPSGYDPNSFFKTGTEFSNALSVSTGTQKNQTYFSLSSLNSKGIIPNNKLNRYNISVRNSTALIQDRLTLDISAMYLTQELRNPPHSGQYINPLVPVYLFPRSDNFDNYKNYERYDISHNYNIQYWPYGDLSLAAQNPYWTVYRMLHTVDRQRLLASVALKYNITSWLNIAGRVKVDNATDNDITENYASTLQLFTGSPNGSYNHGSTTSKQTYADLLLSLNKKMGNFSLNAVLGTSITDNQVNGASIGGALASSGVPNFFSVSNIDQLHIGGGESRSRNQTQAVFLTTQLGYKNYLFLDLTGRNDWISQLAFAEKSHTFYPSVGLSGIISDMVKLPDFISYAKARASMSYVGNPPSPYLTYALYPVTAGVVTPIAAKPFSALKPEKTASFDAGVDLKFMNNKLNFSFTYYNTNTTNQIFSASPPPGSGYSTYYVNAGKINNKGIETMVGYVGNFGALSWNPTLTFTLNRNEIKEVMKNYQNPFTGKTESQDSLSIGGGFIAAGGTLSDIYQRAFVRDAKGNIVTGTDGTLQTTTKAVKVGRSSPDFNIGFNNSFTLHNFYLNILVDGRFGGQVVSATQALMDGYGVSKQSAAARDAGGVNVNGQMIDAQKYYKDILGAARADILGEYVYSATNIRVRELSLGYNFSGKYFNDKIQGLSLGVTARNLLMLYNKAPFDPEVSMATGTYFQGYDYFMQPSLRQLGLQLKVSF
ncbi:SusC/RagA family TonB-linked outer membrane protein [Chitinophaga sp. Cy-1792]|nr:SusC/RagA family TonB-linked outer membrane protein [Chitinophaga sp. Cy-1792]